MTISDKEVAEFTGITDRALRKWRKPSQEIDGAVVYLPSGKHNLYRGARLAYYLLASKDDLPEGSVGGAPNNLEELIDLIEEARKISDLVCDKADNNLLQALKERLDEAKEIAMGALKASELPGPKGGDDEKQ